MTALTNPLEDPVAAVTTAVDLLERFLPDLLDRCTDPQATDMAELLLLIRAARTKLYACEQDAEAALGKAMLEDQVVTNTLRVERRRTAERKAWDHDAWKRDARAKVVQACGLKGAQAIVTADGEAVDAQVLWDALQRLQDVHGAAAPKTGALRALGLDPDEYAERSPGRVTVQVYAMADETEEGAA